MKKFRTAYGPKLKVGLKTKNDNLVEQHHKDDVDINKIIPRYDKSGVLQEMMEFEGQYADLTGINYQDMVDTVANANSAFETLPSELRAMFDHDPAKMLSFMDDESNNEKMYELGLKSRPKPEIDEVGAVATPPSLDGEQSPKGDGNRADGGVKTPASDKGGKPAE